MRILHTSDWHIGAMLCEKSRHEEHAAFLDWLKTLIVEQNIDVLLVAGDVFDTSSPSNRATALYFNFLQSLRGTCCRHIVLTGGNHDSPSHLNAPAAYLAHDGIHVLGCAHAGREDEEVLLLRAADGTPQLIVCAVPFLRDRDVRRAGFGLDPAARTQALCQGVVEHYASVAARAREMQARLIRPVPLLAMGHLFATGSQMQDGEDNLVVGTLGAVDASSFAGLFDYTALGHIHTPQRVGSDRVRYSGSPLAMSFGERAGKVVLLIETGEPGEQVAAQTNGAAAAWPLTITPLEVPVFQELVHVQGTLDELESELRRLSAASPAAWVEADYTGRETPLGDWRECLHEAARSAQGSRLELVRIRDLSVADVGGQGQDWTATRELASCTPEDIFALCLERHAIDEARRPQLTLLFQEILAGLDVRAEDTTDQPVTQG